MPKILIVDDEWITRLEIEEMLIDLGYEVAGQAETGLEAIAMARELKPDLIVMDVEMPGEMNGIDAARVIKAESGTPIIFITGYGDPEHIEAAKEIAPFGYVMKPFDENEVHAFVEIALSKRELELELEKAYDRLMRVNYELHGEVVERKKVNKALSESEKKYRTLITNIPDVTWTADFEGKTIFISPNVENILGYTQEEVYEGGSDIIPGSIHSEDAGKVDAAFNKLIEEGKMFDVEYRIRRKDGEWIWAHDRSITVYERDGLMHADGIFSDITEKKRTEKALRESEKLYRDVFEKNKAIKWVIDPSSGKIIDVNPAACEFYQYSHEEMINLRVWDINMLGETEVKRLINMAENTEQREFTVEHRLASGEIRHVQVYTGPFESGGKMLLHSIIFDVNARWRAEEKRKETVSQLQATLDATADGIIVVNLDGEISVFNQRLKKIWNVPGSILESRDAKKALNYALDQLIEPDMFSEKVYAALANADLNTFDTLHLKDGRILEVYSRPQKLAGNMIGRVWSFRDAAG